MIIRLPIDTKSLYLNIKNDNETGHTATVATPLKQGASYHSELAQILRIPENIHPASKESIVSKLLSKSRAEAIITKVYHFTKISVNGKPLLGTPAFCVYIREETDPSNIHCGRQKVHYPTSLVFEDNEININNRLVMKAVSTCLKDYAFFVDAFEYDTESQVLNFDAIIVGEKDIPYSKVFINRRGVGNKFASVFNEDADSYDMEIIALREKLGYDNVFPDNFSEVMQDVRQTALALVEQYLQDNGAENIRLLTNDYPYSLYDYQYDLNGEKRYLIVRSTSTKFNYFNLQINKIRFCNDFSDITHVALISDILDSPTMHFYTIKDLNNMSKTINSISYTETKEE